jgi:hypothetical protein|tara:strand:+ start:1502 stop:1942 length:441 start_codon:yes stop_codon:yes gene_type:complete
MKTGKTIPIKVHPEFKAHIGTVDSKNLKSIYVQFSTWAQPIKEYNCWGCVVKSFRKLLKTGMTRLIDDNNFKTNMIVDLDLRSSGISIGKKSFMKCEITFFTKSKLNLKNRQTITSIEEKTRKLITEELKGNEYFSFYSTKKENEE